jgi:chemotaxis protein methyltransferase CheR
MKRVLDKFYDRTGICFIEKRDIVIQKIENFYKNRGFATLECFLVEMDKKGDLWQELINFLTVNETYFFREEKQLNILIEQAKKKESFDVLSLPCATGEEVYTIIAMLEMAGLLPRLRRIVGVDINSEVIRSAKTGAYSSKSFHKTPKEVMDRFFTLQGNGFLFKDIYKNKASFEVCNIFEPDIFALGKFDFILSRNMLIYFDKESRAKATNVLVKMLKEGGNLFLGHADIPAPSAHLIKESIGGIVLYHK